MWPLAVALQEAHRGIEEVTCLRAAIKWPNDLVVQGRKLGGLLAEATNHGVVVGAGINVNFAGTALSLDQPLTTVADQLGRPVSREALLIASLRVVRAVVWSVAGGAGRGVAGLACRFGLDRGKRCGLALVGETMTEPL